MTAQTHHAERPESDWAGASVSLMRVLAGVSTIDGRAGAGSFASARRADADGDSARATLAVKPETNRKLSKTQARTVEAVNLRNLMRVS
jgi:hypothetical protein